MNLTEEVKSVEGGGLLLIEKEIGAEDGINPIKDSLHDTFTIYSTKADYTAKTVFEKALPEDYSYLFSIKKPPKVLASYFIDHSGLLLASSERKESGLDPDIFSGMLNAVNNFVKDSIDQMRDNPSEGSLGAMTYEDKEIGDVTIQMSQGRCGVLVVTYLGESSKRVKNEFDSLNREIHDRYSKEVENWDGDSNAEHIISIQSIMKSFFFDSKRFEGTINLDRLKTARENIKEKVLKALEKEYKKNKIALVFDNIQNIDDFSVEMICYIVRNTSIPVVCQSETHVMGKDADQKVLRKIFDGIPEDEITKKTIHSRVDIQTLVKEKLEGIDENVLEVLRYASVLGEFDVGVISEAIEIDRVQVEREMDILQEIGILVDNKFANSRLRQRAYETMTTDEKADIEISIAGSLESRGDEYVPKIAKLLLPHSSKVREKAVIYSIKAAEQFLQNLNLEKALYYYHEAIELDNDKKRKMETLKEVLEIERLTWISNQMRDEYHSDITTLEEVARDAGNEEMLTIAKIHDLRLYKENDLFDLDEAMERFKDIKKHAENLANVELLIKANNLAGIIHRKKNMLDEAVRYYKIALYLSNGNGILSEKFKMQNNIALCLMMKKNWNEAESLFLASLKTAKTLNYTYAIPSLYSNLVYLYSEMGKTSKDQEVKNRLKVKINELTDEAIEICEETGELKNELSILLSSAEFLMTYPDKLQYSRELFLDALDIGEKLGYDTPQALVLMNLCELNMKDFKFSLGELISFVEDGAVEEEFIGLLSKKIEKFEEIKDTLEEKIFM